MNNTIADLNNYLFEQIERLQDDDLTEKDLEREVKRATAISKIATNIIKGGEIALKATSINMEYGKDVEIPEVISGKRKKRIG